jgi:uncharacterized membrane protein YedE/YeeE
MDWLLSLAGGVLIGAASALLLLFNGRIAGISGIVGGVLAPARGEVAWRALFIAGLVSAGGLFLLVAPEAMPTQAEDFGGRSFAMLVAAGLMVGFGTRLGSGCTSGHGVCGIGRLSPRSLVATGAFMLTGLLTVLVAKLVMGGAA